MCPAIVPTPAGPRAEGRPLTIEHASALLAAARDHPLRAATVLALTCGLRSGELLGLHWDDVDLDRELLRVHRVVFRMGGTLQFGPTKTASPRGQLRLPTSTAEALAPAPPSAGRTLLDPANLRRGLIQVTKKAGLGRWHPHELRHSAASLLSAVGYQFGYQ